MKNLFLISLLIGFLLYSCTKDAINIDSDNPFIGVWNFSDYENDIEVFKSSQEFSDCHCYKFNSGGTLVERKNSGWCGTPPVSYADYQGTWEILNDTLIKINVGYWGGSTTYKLDIESVSSETLRISTIQETN
jgi:hypothetical protein